MDEEYEEPFYNEETTTTVSPLGQQADLLEKVLDMDETIADIILKFSGWTYDPISRKLIHVKGAELMNEYGIQRLISTMLSSIAHKGVSLSNLTEKETYDLARAILNDIAKLLFIYHEEFGIKTLADRTIIMDSLRTNIITILKMPKMSHLANFLKMSTKETRVVTAEKKRGLFK